MMACDEELNAMFEESRLKARQTVRDRELEFEKIRNKERDTGKKNDDGKPMFNCLPQDALMELGRVAALGARKYGQHNYRKGIKVSRYIDAAFRHLIAATNGEEEDQAEGNNHWISVAWNALVIYQSLLDDPSLDDRYKKESK